MKAHSQMKPCDAQSQLFAYWTLFLVRHELEIIKSHNWLTIYDTDSWSEFIEVRIVQVIPDA
jgi:hypothetical protein